MLDAKESPSEIALHTRKRPRTNADTPRPDYTTYERDAEFFFNDGNICLASEGTLFKVYGGHLSRHSDVFRVLFNIPKPDAVEQLDGVSVVPLQSSASDIRALLHVVFSFP